MTLHLSLWPRDGFFFKDGRSWSKSGRGHGLLWPFPSTLRGALRTAFGRALERDQGRRLEGQAWRDSTADLSIGMTLPLRRRAGGQPWGRRDRMWPVPADALYVQGDEFVTQLLPTLPQLPTLGRDDDPAREALYRPAMAEKTKPGRPPAWWTEAELAQWLGGGEVRDIQGREREERNLGRRLDVHLAIDSTTSTAEEGALFVTDTTEPFAGSDAGAWEWQIALEAEAPDAHDVTSVPWTIGGDRRLAQAEGVAPELFALPNDVDWGPGSPGLRLIVVTPAWFPTGGWRPDELAAVDGEYRGVLTNLDVELVLRAAFVPKAIHVSGWDMVAGGPRETRQLVRAGAVYFFEKTSGDPFTRTELQGLWLTAVGSAQDDGFGRVVPGLWTPPGR